jgi:hypothetical protein
MSGHRPLSAKPPLEWGLAIPGHTLITKQGRELELAIVTSFGS